MGNTQFVNQMGYSEVANREAVSTSLRTEGTTQAGLAPTCWTSDQGIVGLVYPELVWGL